MEMKETILRLCEKKGTTYAAIARQIGTTKQNICNKFAKNKFYLSDIEKIADALGADVKLQFIDRQTGEAII